MMTLKDQIKKKFLPIHKFLIKNRIDPSSISVVTTFKKFYWFDDLKQKPISELEDKIPKLPADWFQNRRARSEIELLFKIASLVRSIPKLREFYLSMNVHKQTPQIVLDDFFVCDSNLHPKTRNFKF